MRYLYQQTKVERKKKLEERRTKCSYEFLLDKQLLPLREMIMEKKPVASSREYYPLGSSRLSPKSFLLFSKPSSPFSGSSSYLFLFFLFLISSPDLFFFSPSSRIRSYLFSSFLLSPTFLLVLLFSFLFFFFFLNLSSSLLFFLPSFLLSPTFFLPVFFFFFCSYSLLLWLLSPFTFCSPSLLSIFCLSFLPVCWLPPLLTLSLIFLISPLFPLRFFFFSFSIFLFFLPPFCFSSFLFFLFFFFCFWLLLPHFVHFPCFKA